MKSQGGANPSPPPTCSAHESSPPDGIYPGKTGERGQSTASVSPDLTRARIVHLLERRAGAEHKLLLYFIPGSWHRDLAHVAISSWRYAEAVAEPPCAPPPHCHQASGSGRRRGCMGQAVFSRSFPASLFPPLNPIFLAR